MRPKIDRAKGEHDDAVPNERGKVTQAVRHHLYRHFDVLRGVSACAVFVGHIDDILFVRLWGETFRVVTLCAVIARVAVLIFFLLSGYLITQSIRLNIDRNGRFDLTEYLVARVARIYPPFVGAILVCVAVWGIIHWFDLPSHVPYAIPTDIHRAWNEYGFRWSEIPQGLLMIQGLASADGPLWTLYTEFQMYIAAIGIAVWFGPNRFRSAWMALALVGLAFAMQSPIFVVTWLIGAGANLFPIDRKTARRLAALLAGLIILVAVFRLWWLGGVTTPEGERVQMIFSGLCCCVLIFDPPKWCYPQWLVASGDISYSLYVVHWPLLMLTLFLMQNWMGPSYWRASAVAVCAGVSIVIFTIGFARVFECQVFYRRLLRTVLVRCGAMIGSRTKGSRNEDVRQLDVATARGNDLLSDVKVESDPSVREG
jgi:peptidoglycan/LPS O-acetylase OafA/YrhL